MRKKIALANMRFKKYREDPFGAPGRKSGESPGGARVYGHLRNAFACGSMWGTLWTLSFFFLKKMNRLASEAKTKFHQFWWESGLFYPPKKKVSDEAQTRQVCR